MEKSQNTHLNLDQKKPELLMLVGVAGGACVVAGHRQQPLKGRRKLKGLNQAIKASKPLIFAPKKKIWLVFCANPFSFLSNFSPKHIQTPLILLFSLQSQGSALAPILPLVGSIPCI